MIVLRMLSMITALLTWNDVSGSQWWNGWSPNDNNDRYQREPIPIVLASTKTEFKQLWYTKLNGAVIMTPTVYEHHVYVATLNGMFYRLQADNGDIAWQRNLSDFINNGHAYYSRTSPLVYNDIIHIGLTDLNILTKVVPGSGCYFIAFNRFTGVLVWQQRVSSHIACIITDTPPLANNRLFIGISSAEEGFAQYDTYRCCTFQGSVVALDVSTGAFLWETKMIPDHNGTTNGYSGAGVWGSQFPVDYKRNQIYIATGNYYDLPDLVQECVNNTINLTLYSEPCNQPGAYGEAILALDMDTGIIRWSRVLGPIDAWNAACPPFVPVPLMNCPPHPGPDFDFAQAPILKLNFRHKFGGENRDQLFVGKKSGIVFNLDAETGTGIWSNQVSPGGSSGGLEFGSAADDEYLYVGNNNADQFNYILPGGTTTNKASWSALDLVTGDVKWTTVDPTTNTTKTSAYHALTIWDQLVLVQGGSQPNEFELSVKGCLYGLKKTNGEILYEWCIENTRIGSGASVAMNTIYAGIGYYISEAEANGVVALQLPGYDEINGATTSTFSRNVLLFLCLLCCFYIFLLS